MTTPDEDSFGTALGPDRLQELVAKAVNARVNLRQDAVFDVLRVLVFEGNKVDALGFVVGCMVTIQQNLPPGAGIVPCSEGRVAPGAQLFADMLIDYLNGNTSLVLPRFFQAQEEESACAVGHAVNAAARVVRSRRAALQ